MKTTCSSGKYHSIFTKVKCLTTSLILLGSGMMAQTKENDKVKLDQFFDRLAEKDKAMGNLTMAKDNKVFYTRSIGYSEISETEKKPLTNSNRFRIGSITKMFTASMILQLIEEGKLKLTDTIDKFFPEVPNANKITIVQLLWHRSGIPNIKRDQNSQPNANTIPVTKDEILAFIVKVTPEFEPDSKHSYSNTGYHLLGLILEKITVKSYGEILKERITSRIGLNDTYLATGKIDVSKNEALTYMNLGNGWKPVSETHPSILFSAGAIISTSKDLVKFIQALFDGKIVSQTSLDQMKTIRDGEGQGMEPFTFNGKTFYGHTGGADNYGAWVAYLPEERLAFAYTTNAKVYPVKDIINGVMDIYYNKPFQIPSFESIAITTAILDKYVGVYTPADAPVKFTITRKENTLYAQPPGAGAAVPLEAIAENKFKLDNGTVDGIVFEFDLEKSQMIINRAGGQRIFTKEK